MQPNEARPRISLDSRTFQAPPRMSLDARPYPYHPPPPRSSISFQRSSQVPAETQEEADDNFEDVDINEPKPQHQAKKRGIFARIVDGGSEDGGRNGTESKSSWHHFGGRKRGQSGQGAELGAVPKRDAASTPKPLEAQQQQLQAGEASDVAVKERMSKESAQGPQANAPKESAAPPAIVVKENAPSATTTTISAKETAKSDPPPPQNSQAPEITVKS